MAELKEPAHNNLWYGSPVQMSTASRTTTSTTASHSAADVQQQQQSPAGGRPRQQSSSSSWDQPQHHGSAAAAAAAAAPPPPPPSHQQLPPAPHHHQHSHYPSYTNRYSTQQDDAHGLTSHSSLASLKRPYSATTTTTTSTADSIQTAPYQEIVQDLRGDLDGSSKMGGGGGGGVGHDHKLLSFRKVADKHTLVDARGHMQQLELTAQLHGMFFLSEMPATSSDGSVLQPELTCYRRNLFQVSGSLITPRGPLSVILPETGESVPVQSTEVTISAIESVDGHPVRLIVIPWKTPPPNSPEVNQQPDQEPSSLPLIPFQDDGSVDAAEGEFAVYPIGWRRLQFRIATANNGRRKELQQHFVVHLKVLGTLTNGSKVVLSEATTAPIVVRGRSPRNFQARKEIPLLGSSAGSRGQALVETGLGIVAGSLSIKPQEVLVKAARPHQHHPHQHHLLTSPDQQQQLPRTAFTFSSAAKLPPTSPAMRSNSYPSWTTNTTNPHDHQLQQQQQHHPHHQLPTMSDLVVPPIRTQYASYNPTPIPASAASSSLSVPRYVDENPRPTKSPRHPSHPSISTESSSSEYRYPYASSGGETTVSPATTTTTATHPSYDGSSNSATAARDYYSSGAGSWDSGAGTYATNGGGGEHRGYAAAGGGAGGYDYKTPGTKTEPAAAYPGAAALSHYSWNTS